MCSCDVCERSKEFKRHLENVTNEESKQWFSDIFNHLLEVEEDSTFMDIVKKNLRVLYPNIYKEVFTVHDLTTPGGITSKIKL